MKNIVAFLIASFLTSASFGQSAEFETLVEDQSIIWEMEWVGEDSILFTELGGEVRLANLVNGEVTSVYTFTDLARENQAGLMGMQLAHDFSQSHQVYLAYTFYGENFSIYSRISRFTYDSSVPELTNETIVIDSLPARNANLGGRLLVDSNFLYYTSGDLQSENLAQDQSSLAGKILRYNLDGSIPADNPNASSPIFTYGHRNPQGICKTANGNLIISEHGPFNNDEINVLEKGRNFGWPLVGGFKEPANADIYDQYNIKQPIAAYTPTIAPAGVSYYDNGPFTTLSNSIITASLKDKAIHVVHLNAAQDTVTSLERWSVEPIGRIRDVLISPSGRVFAATSNRDIFGDPKEGDDKIVEFLAPFWLGAQHVSPRSFTVNHRQNGLQVVGVKGRVAVTVYDLSGKQVQQKSVNAEEWVWLNTFLSEGIYVVRISNERAHQTFKIPVINHE